MVTIKAMLRRFETVDTTKVAIAAMEIAKDRLATLNAEQINTGLRSDGTFMPDYSKRSVEEFGKPEGPIRLRDTGDWQAGIYVKIEGANIVYGSTDPKTAMLVEGDGYGNGGYGEDILGLSEKFKQEGMREAVQPAYKKEMEAATKLEMK